MEERILMGEKKELSYTKAVILYMLLCFSFILLVIPVLNERVRLQDEELADSVSCLIVEKMNNSIRYMTQSAENMAIMLSVRDLSDYQAEYEELKETVVSADYYSVGLVDAQGNIYAEEDEQAELEKWGMLESLDGTQSGVTIMEPYRWSRNGQIVFTMFAPISQGGDRAGYIFLTYPLKDIQNMADSAVLRDETEIYLMNAYSDNMIYCAGKETDRIGSWSNMKLEKQKLDFSGEGDYEEWIAGMQRGDDIGILTFMSDGVEYTQVFEDIEAMVDWSMVIRIPSKVLSNSAEVFHRGMIALVLILILGSALLYCQSQRREAAEKRILERLSSQDALTGLYNRWAFSHLTERMFKRADVGYLAFLFIDIDYFKAVNDTYGHDVGDQLLRKFAELLQSCFGEKALIARQGGDEFVVCVEGLSSGEEVDRIMTELQQKAEGLTLETADGSISGFHMSFSAGIAEYPKHADNLEDLMRCADRALYQVKENGRKHYLWYDADQYTAGQET